jgi:hypothetical protein
MSQGLGTVARAWLEHARKETHTGTSYLKNLLISIAGFASLGFFVGAYFSSVPQFMHGILATIVAERQSFSR